jgi:hypothetical protein
VGFIAFFDNLSLAPGSFVKYPQERILRKFMSERTAAAICLFAVWGRQNEEKSINED